MAVYNSGADLRNFYRYAKLCSKKNFRGRFSFWAVGGPVVHCYIQHGGRYAPAECNPMNPKHRFP